MSRLKYRFATSSSDVTIQTHLEKAMREVSVAAHVASQSSASRLRKRRVERDLSRAMSAISEVSSLSIRFGGDDPDLVETPPTRKADRSEVTDE